MQGEQCLEEPRTGAKLLESLARRFRGEAREQGVPRHQEACAREQSAGCENERLPATHDCAPRPASSPGPPPIRSLRKSRTSAGSISGAAAT